MRRPPVDRVVALIIDNAHVARRVVIDMNVPRRDGDDLVQEALTIALDCAAKGNLRLPGDPKADRRIVAAFLAATTRNLALAHWRFITRVELPGDLPEASSSPFPQLEARSELRRVVRESGVLPLKRGKVSIVDYLCGPDVPDATASVRRYRLRWGRKQ